MLACPYCKRDAHRHKKCCTLGWGKISHVKQHIYRAHSLPIYCPVCMEMFDDVRSRDQHNRRRDCQAPDVIVEPDGITPDQREHLSRRVSSRLSEEEQWFSIWDYLFPDRPRPSSPYNDFELSEGMVEFRKFITSDAGTDVLLRNLRWVSTLMSTPVDDEVLRQGLNSGLEEVFFQWAARRVTEGAHEGTAVATRGQDQEPADNGHRSNNDAGPSGTAAERAVGSAFSVLNNPAEPQIGMDLGLEVPHELLDYSLHGYDNFDMGTSIVPDWDNLALPP